MFFSDLNKTNFAPNFNFYFSFFPIKYRLKFKEQKWIYKN
ncbi:hypothetical protein CSUNSWCD_1852 [Campylobacter showae CSUNSWCD]|uniref:Uncharacterized protein n=1 Tax=Campylobacter showae CSUNSWCD TaxID=1244083 RepID=M5IQH6_9BACT|nr:hypothetical protein CSUNSWCD_1852 [Campylobacter showae CSUNSWCD]